MLAILIEADFPMSREDIHREARGHNFHHGIAIGIRRGEIGVEWIGGRAWYWFKGVSG